MMEIVMKKNITYFFPLDQAAFVLTLVLPSLFCNMVYYQGDGYHPLMNLKLTGPNYDCLIPWYRVGSVLSIDTKIIKIGQRMKSQ